MEEEYKIELDNTLLDSGGYLKIKSNKEKSPFVEVVNRKLGDYWVRTGRERNIQDVIFEVLGEKYDEITKSTCNVESK